MWMRFRVTDEGATDSFYAKSWYGGMGDEPAGWDTSQTGVSARSASLGTKIGWLLPELVRLAEQRIAFLSYTTIPDTESPTTPTEAVAATVAAVPNLPYAETGPIEMGQGDQVMQIQYAFPDEDTLGKLDMYLTPSFHPTDDLTEQGPYSAAEPTSIRLSGRSFQVRYEQASSADVEWRLGNVRRDAELGGLR
jgi:hypothetical protein